MQRFIGLISNVASTTQENKAKKLLMLSLLSTVFLLCIKIFGESGLSVYLFGLITLIALCKYLYPTIYPLIKISLSGGEFIVYSWFTLGWHFLMISVWFGACYGGIIGYKDKSIFDGLLLGFGVGTWSLIWVMIFPFIKKLIPQSKQKTLGNEKRPSDFHVWGGQSTGILLNRSHVSGMNGNKNVWLKLPDLCQNVIVFGGIGSGKTTRIIQPYLMQLLSQNSGGLIFDIKGDFKTAVNQLAQRNGRNIEAVGVGQKGINLLKGLTPEMTSSFLKSAFYLSGSGKGDAFWIDTATELCKNCLGVLSFCGNGYYSLDKLYRYIFFENDRSIIQKQIETILFDLTDERKAQILQSYLSYYDNIFSKFDEKVKQGVLATVSQVLSPFQHPDLIDSFCVDSDNMANMEDVLEGKIFIVDLPLSTWGIGAKTVYTFIKLRFFNVLQSRQARNDLNQTRPVFFMCDEYQEIISASKSGLSDLNFWDKSRSSKCIGIISSQSVNSFRSAIGDKTLADTVLQNFRQKYCFRTEDIDTLNYLNQIAGKAEVKRETETQGTNQSSGTFNSSSGSNSGVSVSWQERQVVDAQLIRQLGQNQAIAFLNIDGLACDDVVNLEPLFVD